MTLSVSNYNTSAAWAAGGMPEVWSGASQRMGPSQKMNNLFSNIDTAGTGTITKAQFEQAFQSMNPPASFKSMGADSVFAQLDPKNTGSVSRQDFVSGMTNMMGKVHGGHGHHHHGSAAAAGSSTVPASTSQTQPTSGVTLDIQA